MWTCFYYGYVCCTCNCFQREHRLLEVKKLLLLLLLLLILWLFVKAHKNKVQNYIVIFHRWCILCTTYNKINQELNQCLSERLRILLVLVIIFPFFRQMFLTHLGFAALECEQTQLAHNKSPSRAQVAFQQQQQLE